VKSPDGPKRQSTTVSWHDATGVLPRILALDGLAYVQAVARGELPPDPLMEVLGIAVTEAERGRVVMEAVPQPGHLNLGGIVHGGFLSTLLDCATGFALHTTFEPGQTGPHVQVAYGFLEAARAGERLRCEGNVLRSGGRLGHVRAEVTGADGRVIATGQTTNAVMTTKAGGFLRAGPSA
jgi:acyl-CoA thioesterase